MSKISNYHGGIPSSLRLIANQRPAHLVLCQCSMQRSSTPDVGTCKSIRVGLLCPHLLDLITALVMSIARKQAIKKTN